jgi:uncharacterized protein
MTDHDDTNSGADGDESTLTPEQKADKDLVEKLVAEKLAENLKEMKEKLDKAYSARDEAMKKAAEYEKQQREAEIARLKDEGKHKEAYEKQLAEERAAREALEKRNIELTRDSEVRANLTGLNFRNEKAVDVAFQDIVKQMVRGEDGTWVHRSGVAIRDFVKAYAESEDNSFLFKVKASSGSGSSGPSKEKAGSTDGSVFGTPQADLLRKIEEGKLQRNRGS